MASFSLSPRPLTSSSPTWGPSSTPLPPQFTSLPYAPFSPTDRLGRAADFTQTSAWKASRRSQSDANEEFQYKVDSETSEFQLVDTAKKVRGRCARATTTTADRGRAEGQRS